MNQIDTGNNLANLSFGVAQDSKPVPGKAKVEQANAVAAQQAKLERAAVEKAVKAEQPVEKEKVQLTAPQLEKVAEQLQKFVSQMNKGLEFLVDKESGLDVIKVIDRNSGDLVKQFPSEEFVELAAKLSEATGNFINSEV